MCHTGTEVFNVSIRRYLGTLEEKLHSTSAEILISHQPGLGVHVFGANKDPCQVIPQLASVAIRCSLID
jgi:hypothetical protein